MIDWIKRINMPLICWQNTYPSSGRKSVFTKDSGASTLQYAPHTFRILQKACDDNMRISLSAKLIRGYWTLKNRGWLIID